MYAVITAAASYKHAGEPVLTAPHHRPRPTKSVGGLAFLHDAAVIRRGIYVRTIVTKAAVLSSFSIIKDHRAVSKRGGITNAAEALRRKGWACFRFRPLTADQTTSRNTGDQYAQQNTNL